ncbi:hypothetical protein DVH24_028779 [Malus domestica]|uniref:Arabinose 5-phosphate isomerase n=1 Tax=Malus domestica TaxID=3750 RepID=A0A498IVA9_MALDO|nr:hypothetical protein DVH24_028779 [Malus domestica]
MGSLPPSSADFINPHSPPKTKTTTTTQFSSSAASPFCMDETTLLNLFKSQQSHLNFFFQHLDLPRTLAFTQTLLLQSSVGATIFFSGVGKSGFVAHKISQTLVSLGIRSGFLSPLDALHGDIGALSKTDILVLFSKSGTTEELLRLVPCAKAKGAFLISVTSVDGNALASVCDMNVHLPLQRELCPFDLAPVTSTAIQMVFGDTVAIALMGAKNLTKEQYAANHPAGRIGKSLIFKVRSCLAPISIIFNPILGFFFSPNFLKLQVNDVMKKEDELPVCKEGDLIMEQLVKLTSKGCGCLLVIDAEHRLIGTFTDGDLRRTLKASGEAIFKLTVGEMCNRHPRTIGPDAMAVEAMQKMEAPPSPVQFLPVINDQNQVIGIVTLHGLVSAGL